MCKVIEGNSDIVTGAIFIDSKFKKNSEEVRAEILNKAHLYAEKHNIVITESYDDLRSLIEAYNKYEFSIVITTISEIIGIADEAVINILN